MNWHHEYWLSEVANKYSWANVVRFVMCQQHFFDVETCMCSCLRYTSSSVQPGRSWPEWAAKRSSLFADSRESDSARQGSQMHPCTLLHTPAGFRRTDLKVINRHFQGWSALFFSRYYQLLPRYCICSSWGEGKGQSMFLERLQPGRLRDGKQILCQVQSS